MNKWIRIIIISVLIGILFYSDFARDYFFKNTSFQIYYLEHMTDAGVSTIDNYTDSLLEDFFENFTIKDLIYFKWFLTFAFTIYFMGLCMLISYFVYRSKSAIKYTLILYGSLFLFGVVMYGLRWFSDSYTWQENTYLIAMQIIHFLQSSLPTLFILASFKIYLTYKDSELNK